MSDDVEQEDAAAALDWSSALAGLDDSDADEPDTAADAADDAADEELERRDRAVKGVGFKSWLADNADNAEYSELATIVAEHRGEFPRKYKFSEYANKLEEFERVDLIDALLTAETEWRVDSAARSKARSSLAIDSSLTKSARTGSTVIGGVTSAMPVPVPRCGFKDRGGHQCPKLSLPGAVRCEEHGGDWLDPTHRQMLLLNSYARLVEASADAVDALVHVAVHGTREEARVMAAREILDRAGIRAGVDININLTGDAEGKSAAEQLLERLDSIAAGMTAREEIAPPRRDEDIIDAEVVEDTAVEVVTSGTEPS